MAKAIYCVWLIPRRQEKKCQLDALSMCWIVYVLFCVYYEMPCAFNPISFGSENRLRFDKALVKWGKKHSFSLSDSSQVACLFQTAYFLRAEFQNSNHFDNSCADNIEHSHFWRRRRRRRRQHSLPFVLRTHVVHQRQFIRCMCASFVCGPTFYWMGGIVTVVLMHIYITFLNVVQMPFAEQRAQAHSMRFRSNLFLHCEKAAIDWRENHATQRERKRHQVPRSLCKRKKSKNPSAIECDKRTKNEKAHTQFQMYFAVLRVLPQILLIFSCVHSVWFPVLHCLPVLLIPPPLRPLLLLEFLLLLMLLLLMWCVLQLYYYFTIFFFSLSVFCLINYQVYLLVSFSALLCD